jgi:Ca2+-binding RTX toxin-like protein
MLNGGPGEDTLRGGAGDDFFDARDGSQDLIDCGDGEDTVVVDSQEDGVFNCENVEFPPGS